MCARMTRVPLFVSCMLALVMSADRTHAQDSADPSLYHRMGGYDVVAAVVDDFFARFGSDPILVPFLGGLNATAGARVRQHFVDFACATTGGPCLYNGLDMKTTHDGLPIADQHFDAVMRHFSAALDHNGVGEREKQEFLALLSALRPEIVAPRASSTNGPR